MKYMRYILLLTLFIFTAGSNGISQDLDYNPKILLVTAHPDDDALFSATVFKTTHLLDGTVDLALMTNGEGGYRYSTLGNYIYDKQLDKEEVGRKYLPNIRKKELMAGGDIVGLRNYYFFDELDDQYSLDVELPLENWNTEVILERLQDIIQREQYDFVFTMLPYEGTHGHHKASALLALQTVEQMDEDDRPLVLAGTMLSDSSDTTEFTELEGYPLTKVDRSVEPSHFDRTQTFGHNDELNYMMIANWVIAEHKSQGTMQQLINGAEIEQYLFYELNKSGQEDKVRTFFEAVREAEMYDNPNNLDSDE